MENDFSGIPNVFTKNTNVEIWLSQLDNYLESKDIVADSDKIEVFASFLDDKTFMIVDYLVTDSTYNQIKNRFRTLFSNPEIPKQVYLLTFIGRNQEPNESLVQYAEALNNIGKSAFDGLTARERDSYFRDRFLAGIRNRTIAEKLALLDFPDLGSMVSKAREEERNLNYSLNHNTDVFEIPVCPFCKVSFDSNNFNTHVQSCAAKPVCNLCQKTNTRNHFCKMCRVCKNWSPVNGWFFFPNCGHVICGETTCIENYRIVGRTNDGQIRCHSCRVVSSELKKLIFKC